MPRGDTIWMRLDAARDSELWRLAAVVEVGDAPLKSRAVLIEEISSRLRAAAGHSIRN